MARGGRRQGTPGKGYSNRTDLMQPQNRAPQTATATAASGGQGQAAPQQTFIQPEDVTALDAPSSRPDEPVTAGLMSGPGAGPEALGAVPGHPLMKELEAAFMQYPTPALGRALRRFRAQGRL